MHATFGFGERVCWTAVNAYLRNRAHIGTAHGLRAGTAWITRKGAKVDRIACPWVIKRFVDPEAQFFFSPEEDLLYFAERYNAIPFDAPRLSCVKLNHRDERCTFEAILEDYQLTDPALHRLGLIVRGADVSGQEHVSPESPGLRAMAHGFALSGISDEERLAREFPIYDALYEYVRAQLD